MVIWDKNKVQYSKVPVPYSDPLLSVQCELARPIRSLTLQSVWRHSTPSRCQLSINNPHPSFYELSAPCYETISWSVGQLYSPYRYPQKSRLLSRMLFKFRRGKMCDQVSQRVPNWPAGVVLSYFDSQRHYHDVSRGTPEEAERSSVWAQN